MCYWYLYISQDIKLNKWSMSTSTGIPSMEWYPFHINKLEMWNTPEPIQEWSKIHWASKETYHLSEWHSLKTTTLKLIIFGHRKTKVLLMKHLKSQRVAFVKKEKNVKSQKVIFQKSQKLLTENLHSMIDRLFRTFNSSLFLCKGGLCNRHTGYCPCRAPYPGGERCDFDESWPLVISPYFTLFLFKQLRCAW